MKRLLLAAAALVCAVSSNALAQSLNYTPRAEGAYLNSGSGWSPWANGASFGTLDYTPYPVGLYCQSSPGGAWSPCQPGGGAILPSGDSAEYPFNDGSGTIVSDISGNGNNATFGSATASPTWYSYGVSFLDAGTATSPTQYVSTPLTTFKTAVVALCTPTMVTNTGTAIGGVPGALFPTIIGSSNASQGIAWLADGSSWTTQVSTFPEIIPIGAGGGNTQSKNGWGGCHVDAITLDTFDHIFVDGREVSNYWTQNANSGVVTLTSGNYNIGTTQTSSSSNSLRGVVSYAIFWPNALTAAQVQTATAYVQQKLSQRPSFPKYPTLTTSPSPAFQAVGDSLTAGFEGTSQWTAATTFNNTYATTNYGIAGMTAFDVCNMSNQRWVQGIVPGSTIVHLWAGTNDFAHGWTAAGIWGSLSSCVQYAHAYGAKIFVATMIDRTGLSTQKNQLNALIRSGWQQAGFDGIDDIAMTPLGADGANTNTACFNADKTHLTGPGAGTCGTVNTTDLTGYGIVAAVVSANVNAYTGSTKVAPDTTSSNAFVESASNVYVIQTPTGAATTSLWDCQGQWLPRTIVNGSGSFAITVSGINSQTITGSSTVAANTIAQFTPQLTSPTAAGCYWLRTQ